MNERANKEGKMETLKIDKIKKIGSEWIKGDFHRIYFNSNTLRDLIGLEINFYNTGNVSSAYQDGVLISNTKANKLLVYTDFSKIFFDVNSGEFKHGENTNIEFFENIKSILIKKVGFENE